ncbi:hypothetical protein AWC38_SpisGene13869 [Stylophora pistillata]|uniref:Uncharacterized protein n=2 Tax=Stylophora pistillata TaxID=50429 RepID=A0A2B4RXW4_STYPI|nr:hypothetical protein AWC38_SpisGene13869 [Stylophora pistillata]
MKRDNGVNQDSLRTKRFQHFSAQDLRNSSSVSRGDLCGWEISQLLLLHDDFGIVEWVKDEERSMFSVTNETGWCHSYFGCLTPRSAVSILETAQNDGSAMDTFSCRLHEETSGPLTANNLHALRGMPKQPDKQDEELRQTLPTNRTARNVRMNTSFDPSRLPERRPHLLDTRPLLSPVAKMCNLERRLEARRKSKIERGVESLRQPLTTKARTCLGKRELFNPSVISVMAGDLDSDITNKDSRDSRKKLYKKYLQLLPIDSMLKMRRHANTVNISPPKKCLTPLPAIEVQSVIFSPKLSCNQKQLDKTPFKSYRP